MCVYIENKAKGFSFNLTFQILKSHYGPSILEILRLFLVADLGSAFGSVARMRFPESIQKKFFHYGGNFNKNYFSTHLFTFI
jgi:hypothetical protein